MASFLRNDSQQSRTTLDELFGRAFLSVGLFVPLSYLINYLCSHRYVTAGYGAHLLDAFWAASILYSSIKFCRQFPRFYRATISRMRLFGSVRWVFLSTLGCAVLVAILYLMLRSFDFDVPGTIESRSIEPLIFAYSVSLFLVFYLCVIICNIVAEARGTF
jgi:hypothetical protein